ncbi:MAG: InlB B-repeat-containing protein, partial [Clostridia bacterium]|nr:InlB B-repeat-containing protein [Clostridia bacterium]
AVLAGSGDYYGLNLNLQPIIGDVISNVYLTILRDDNGLSGVKVKTTAASALTVTINLDKGISTNVNDAQKDYFKYVTGKHDIDFYENPEDPVTHIQEVFGCYSTEKGTYDSLNILGKVALNVVGYGEVPSQTASIKSTSTVHLRDPHNVVWADGSHIIVFFDEDGNELGTEKQIMRDMTIYSQPAVAYEVIFDMNGVAETYTGAVTLNQTLPRFNGTVEGKIFVKWIDKNGVTVNSANEIALDGGVRRVYAVFANEVEVVNGVQYTASWTNGLHYSVSGVTSLDAKYTKAGGEYLVLEREINGIPVTEISAGAFASTKEKPVLVKNVVVPESVTVVGSRAFLDNYAIESIIFLADSVRLDGVEKESPFYGCSKSDGSSDTNLTLYYTDIEGEDGWNVFRVTTNLIGMSTPHKLSSLVNSGWAWVEYYLTGASLTQGLECLAGGLYTDTKTAEQIEGEVFAEINALTSKDFINGYSVSVDRAVELNGLNKITVTLTETTPYYLLTIKSEQTGFILNGEFEIYGGEKYVKAGTTVTVLPPEGYELTSLTGTEHDNYSFVMTGYALELTAECESVAVEEYVLNSAVETFTMNGVEYHNGDTVSADIPLSTDVEADGYYFLGWAYNNGTQLQFVSGGAAEYGNYYAVWAVNYSDVLDYSAEKVNTTGTVPAVNFKTGKAATFNGWYTEAAFTNKVESLSASTTVLYASLQFSLTLTLNGSNTTWYYTVNDPATPDAYRDVEYTENKFWGSVTSWTINENNGYTTKITGNTFSLELEYGQTVELYREWSNAIVFKIKDGETYVATYLIKGFNTKDNKSWRNQANSAEHCFELNSGNWIAGDGTPVEQDNPDNYKYYNTSGSNVYFGKVENLNSNVVLATSV